MLRYTYRSADKSLARPASRCILFGGENISFDASLVLYIYIYIYIYRERERERETERERERANIPPILMISRIYDNQNLPSL
jgi:hypothetical protein